MAAKQAFGESLQHMWVLCTAMSALGLFVSMFIGVQKLSREHYETKTGIKKEKENSEGPREGIDVTSKT